MTILSVNLNKIALLRNSREGDEPNIIEAAKIAISNGAKGITVHPRSDQRHIRPQDIIVLTEFLREQAQIEFNIEGNPLAKPNPNGYPGFSHLVCTAKPEQVTLVPDTENQLTSDHGWDLTRDNEELADLILLYKSVGSRISLFMDPDPEQITLAKKYGADRIELYTGPFAKTLKEKGIHHKDSRKIFALYREMATLANDLGLGVNAGHDLNTLNLEAFREIDCLLEVSIGHALINDSLTVGLAQAVRMYVNVLNGDKS